MDHGRKFQALTARKAREAIAASLPPYTTAFDDHPPHAQAIGNGWTRALFDGAFYESPPPEDAPLCNLVFVQSHDGNTGARNPATLGGGETDKHLIYEGLSRVAADAVLAGAETIRDAQMILSVWHPELVALRESLGLPRHPMQVVATLRGLDLAHGLLFNVPEVPVCLLTIDGPAERMAADLAARPWISVIRMPSPQHLRDGLRRLREMGVRRISAIGGRKLATQLIDAKVVQDVYLTTSPIDAGEPGTPMYPRPLPARAILRKKGTGQELGVVFEHFVLEDAARC